MGFQERLLRHRRGNSISGQGTAHANARKLEELIVSGSGEEGWVRRLRGILDVIKAKASWKVA